jgi:DNA-dependent RNA polymerase auxiliary subunit epsilon
MYLDSNPDKIPERAVIIPYTREQYLALPRKKKKSMLTTVRSIIDYRDTKDALDKLMNENMANPYNLERIARLEDKLAEYEKALPKSIFWDECIRQLKK